NHDDAYEWARRRKVAVNPNTGTLQVYETVAAVSTVFEEDPAASLFAGVGDTDLETLGVPGELLGYVKSLVAESDFYSAKDVLPADAFENLSWIVNGIPLSEVLDMVRGETEQADEIGIADALNRPESLRSFFVVEGEDELFQVLSAPLEKWRVFLHPSQRKLVKRSYNGSARVLGGAGTGKTVVAMHRAKYLAQSSGDMLPGIAETGSRVLFTTFSSTLAADISENLQKMCSKEELRRIDVVNLDSWVSRFLRQNDLDFQIEYEDDVLNDVWAEAISDSDTTLDFEPQFYADEWSQVILAQDIQDETEYAHARRVGRGVRLNRKKRNSVWGVVDRYRQLLKARRMRDVDFAMSECAKLVLSTNASGMYSNIVVDEGQDFSAPAYRLIRALAGPEHKNDIFIVGDSHQRIYRRKAVLSQCGINIRGRSSILRINYRTTEEIRRRAMAVLSGLGFDDLDGGVDDDPKAQSLLHGLDPMVTGFPNESDEIEYVAREAERLQHEGVDLRDICVVARTNKKLNAHAYGLQKLGLPVCELKSRKADDRKREGVRLASMHRVKGLEFDHVFIVDASDGVLPPRSAMKRAQQEDGVDELLQSEKCLLYVAMTRAKKSVSISYVGVKSGLLEPTD
ncbi:MAG: ATP-dependent helicase, partial [Eggerthellaceae bacterium]|nr:ATP-dependent helicase [Eggerthellaceae bacterium]